MFYLRIFQNLFKTGPSHSEIVFLSGSVEMVDILESIHFFAAGVLTQRQPRRQIGPFTFQHFQSLLAKLDAQCINETTDGPCSALRFLLVHEHNKHVAATFPQQHNNADQQQQEDNNVAVVVPPQNQHIPVQATNSLKPFMHSLSAKSAASFMGFAPAAVMFAFAALAKGLHAASTVVPKVLLTMRTAADLADIRSAVFRDLLSRGQQEQAKQYADHTNPKTNRRAAFSNNPFNNDFLQAFAGLGIANDLVPTNNGLGPPGTSAAAYVQRVIEPTLLSLIDHLSSLLVTPQSNTDIGGYAHGETQTTVLNVVASVYPALYNFLAQSSPQFILPTQARPILAHLVRKAGILFLRDDTYNVSSRDNARGDPVLDKRQYTPPFSHRSGDFYCFTVTMLIDEYCQPVLLDPVTIAARNTQIVDMLSVIGETKEYVSTTRVEEQRCGAVTSWHHRLKRRPNYVIDLVHKNNASLKSSPYRAATQGVVETCCKEFPTTQHWTPGIMLATCACSNRSCYHGHFMDQHESPLTPFEILTNRFPGGCPLFVIYDNACHLLMYCMQREPSWFWRCRFVVDRFHEPNHVSSCSSSLHASSYTSGPLSTANSEAVEQLNKVLRARLETRLRFMNLDHAVVFLLVFIAQFNNKSK